METKDTFSGIDDGCSILDVLMFNCCLNKSQGMTGTFSSSTFGKMLAEHTHIKCILIFMCISV